MFAKNYIKDLRCSLKFPIFACGIRYVCEYRNQQIRFLRKRYAFLYCGNVRNFR